MTSPDDPATPGVASADPATPAMTSPGDPETPGTEAVEVEDAGEAPPTLANRALGVTIEWLVVLVCALGLALLLRTFLVEVFEIPSRSMEPTMTVDDRVVVYKVGYRLHDVNRGDVVVFSKPGEAPDADDLIKRVVAVGGETLEISDGWVYVDGQRLDEPYLLNPNSTNPPPTPMPGCENEPSVYLCEVPEGHVLVLGDNRHSSRDGRYFGPVDVDDIVGRAFMKIWPLNDLGGL